MSLTWFEIRNWLLFVIHGIGIAIFFDGPMLNLFVSLLLLLSSDEHWWLGNLEEAFIVWEGWEMRVLGTSWSASSRQAGVRQQTPCLLHSGLASLMCYPAACECSMRSQEWWVAYCVSISYFDYASMYSLGRWERCWQSQEGTVVRCSCWTWRWWLLEEMGVFSGCRIWCSGWLPRCHLSGPPMSTCSLSA